MEIKLQRTRGILGYFPSHSINSDWVRLIDFNLYIQDGSICVKAHDGSDTFIMAIASLLVFYKLHLMV